MTIARLDPGIYDIERSGGPTLSELHSVMPSVTKGQQAIRELAAGVGSGHDVDDDVDYNG
jgi:hypothetical protein